MPDPKLESMTPERLSRELAERVANLENAQMAVTVATDARNEVVLVMNRRGMRNVTIANELGCSPARIGQILAAAEVREQEVAA